MNRDELRCQILKQYNATTDFPWRHFPTYEAFRHPETNKIFAMIADVPCKVIEPESCSNEMVSIINLKCGPIVSTSLHAEPGFYPAYHMKKGEWITAEIGVASDETVMCLLDMSFDSTLPVQKEERHYPETFLSDLFDRFKDTKGSANRPDKEKKLTLYDVAMEINRSDAEFANVLISFLDQKKQDIIKKYYKNGMTIKAIADELDVSCAAVGHHKNVGLKRIISRWRSIGAPVSVADYEKYLEKCEQAEKNPYLYINLDSSIGMLDLSSRVHNVLRRSGINTVADFMNMKDPQELRKIGPKMKTEIVEMQEKLRKEFLNRSQSAAEVPAPN